MKKTNKYFIIASAIAVMGISSGCAAKSDTQTTAAETTISESTTGESADGGARLSEGANYDDPIVDVKKMAEDFVGLLGQTDDKVVALLGEGDFVVRGGEALPDREYSMELFEESVTTIAAYEGSKVSGIFIILQGTDMAAYQTQLTAALGAPDSTRKNQNDGSDVEVTVWKIGGGNFQLTRASDDMTIQIYTPK